MPSERYEITQVYDLDYFSSSQCFLYIGDVWVDEITSLNYVTMQRKNPIYGYASQLFDDTRAGHVIVQGSFSINFKEQGYLWAVLRRYKNLTQAGFQIKRDRNLFRTRKGSRRDMPDLTNNKGTRVGSNGTRISRDTIERVVQGNIKTSERFKFYQDLAGYATHNVNSPKDKVFEDIVEAFEDQVWTPDINNVTLNSQVRRTDDNKFDDFDIFVVFGDYSNPAANHTVQKITGVRLTGQSKQITNDGNPVQEVYEFFARSTV